MGTQLHILVERFGVEIISHCEMGLMITYEHSVRLCVTIFFQRLTWTMMKNSCLAGLRNWTAADTKFTTEKSIQLVRYPASI